MWGRALKGQQAAQLVRHLLTSKRLPPDDDDFAKTRETPKRGPRNKPPALM
jgi:hypothetical protein